MHQRARLASDMAVGDGFPIEGLEVMHMPSAEHGIPSVPLACDDKAQNRRIVVRHSITFSHTYIAIMGTTAS